MKPILLQVLLVLLLTKVAFTQQSQSINSYLMTQEPWDGTPMGRQGNKPFGWPKNAIEQMSLVRPNPIWNVVQENDELEGATSKVDAAYQVGVLKGFTANNMSIFTPGDNSIGVSNAGFIVSADNQTIDYYRDTPDTLLQFQAHHTFYADQTLNGVPFDPRVIYDRYSNRFIVITLAYADSASNYILLSFSRDEDPQNGWNHYRLKSDTLADNQWFDYANIAVNKDELFITGNMYHDNGQGLSGNKVYQIHKSEGYSNQTLKFKLWTNVLDGEGDIGYTLVPLSDGMMRESYNRGVFLVSTKSIGDGQSSDKLFWYQINDSFNAPNVTLAVNSTPSGIPYSNPAPGLQFGNAADIRLSNAKAHSGFYLDSTLNFVYCRAAGNYSVIVLNRLNIRTNTLQRYPWGFSSNFFDYTYPSIAFTGADSMDTDNITLGFMRTSSNSYPEICAVHFDDGAFHQNSTVVRNGEGWIDFYAGGTTERWGDYTTIQRRYDQLPVRSWLAGCYPNGPNANNFGVTYHLNAFIAELGDTVGIGNPRVDATVSDRIQLFPNPSRGRINVRLNAPGQSITNVAVQNSLGASIPVNLILSGEGAQIDLQYVASGLYFVAIQVNHKWLKYEKIIVDRRN